jgi:hypothetical protein
MRNLRGSPQESCHFPLQFAFDVDGDYERGDGDGADLRSRASVAPPVGGGAPLRVPLRRTAQQARSVPVGGRRSRAARARRAPRNTGPSPAQGVTAGGAWPGSDLCWAGPAASSAPAAGRSPRRSCASADAELFFVLDDLDDGGGLCGAATDDEAEEAVEVVEAAVCARSIAGGAQLCGHSCGIRRPKQVRLRTKPRLSRLRAKPRRLSLQ